MYNNIIFPLELENDNIGWDLSLDNEDNFINWAYSFNSLFNLAATYTNQDMFVKLVDHHRSHKHIIDFSNSEFSKFEFSLFFQTDQWIF